MEGQTAFRPLAEASTINNELIIVGAFLRTGLLAYAVTPGLLATWDRVLDNMENSGTREKK